VPLAQQLAGTAEEAPQAVMQGDAAFWYPCPLLRDKISNQGRFKVPAAVVQLLDVGGQGKQTVTVEVVGPTAAVPAAVVEAATADPAAAAAASGPAVVLPDLGTAAAPQLVGRQNQQPQYGTEAVPGSTSINWGFMQKEEGLTVAAKHSVAILGSMPAWRKLVGPWGSWYLFKAQAVRRAGADIVGCQPQHL
jgi:hypothetical protein